MKFTNIIFWAMCFQKCGCDFSSLHGKWKPALELSNNSYFHVKDSSIYAIKENAKLSMDIRNFKKNDNIMQLQLDNLQVHHAGIYLSMFDYRVIRFVRRLMKHGMTLEFSTLPDSTLSVTWKIHENGVILQEGNVCLSKCHNLDDS